MFLMSIAKQTSTQKTQQPDVSIKQHVTKSLTSVMSPTRYTTKLQTTPEQAATHIATLTSTRQIAAEFKSPLSINNSASSIFTEVF